MPANAGLFNNQGTELVLQDCMPFEPIVFSIDGETITKENKNDLSILNQFNLNINEKIINISSLLGLLKEGFLYTDQANLIEKKINKKIQKIIFTGEEDFTYNQYYCNIYTIPELSDYHNSESDYDLKCGALCTHFGLMNFGSITPTGAYKNGYFGMRKGGSQINFGYCPDGENEATSEELKNYFKSQYEQGTPVIIYYILKTEKINNINNDNIIFNDGENKISSNKNYKINISYYKRITINEAGEGDNISKENFIFKGISINPDDQWWNDFKNFMGRNPEISPIDEQMKSPLVSNGMITAFADRWKTGQQGMSTKGVLSDSVFVQGGHVFEGWDTEKEWRLTALIGKFSKGRCHIFSFKPNESGVEEFGIVTVGGDHEWDGMDFSQKYAQMWGNIVASSFSGPTNYGSQKYYGGISGQDKTKPSGANLEITADYNSQAPKQARFNNCDNGLVIPILESTPSILNNGTIWYDSIENKVKIVVNGNIKNFIIE